MCKLMEDYGNRREARGKAIGEARGEARGKAIGEAKGKAIGKKESAKEFALKLWSDGIRDIERVSRLTSLSPEEVKALIESNTN